MKPEHYREYAAYFDFFSNPFVLPDTFEAVDVLATHLPKKSRIVDVGGGTGLMAAELIDQRPDVQITLVEPSAEMAAHASQRLKAPHRVLNVALQECLPELDPPTVFLFNRSLYAFYGERARYGALLEQIVERLEPRGFVAIFEFKEKYNIPELKAYMDTIRDDVPGWSVDRYREGWPILEQALSVFNDGVDSGVFTLFEEGELDELLRGAGLEQVYVEGFSYLYRLPKRKAKRGRWF